MQNSNSASELVAASLLAFSNVSETADKCQIKIKSDLFAK